MQELTFLVIVHRVNTALTVTGTRGQVYVLVEGSIHQCITYK